MKATAFLFILCSFFLKDLSPSGNYYSHAKMDHVVLDVKPDGTFNETWHSCTFGIKCKGKWQLSNDTLILDNEHAVYQKGNAEYVRSANKFLITSDSLILLFKNGNAYHRFIKMTHHK